MISQYIVKARSIIISMFIDAPKSLVALILFFIASLFLGDGKQPFVDVFMGLGIIIAYFIAWKIEEVAFSVPRTQHILWILLMLYCIVAIPFSDSPGYSISATIRLIEGYLVYVLACSYASEKIIQWFWRAIILLVGVASAAFLVFILFPRLATFLPSMNLIYSPTRHSHLADLLLFVLPGITLLFFQRKNRETFLLYLFFLVAFFLTFARGAWVLYGVFLAWMMVGQKNFQAKILLGIMSVGFIGLFAVLSVGLPITQGKNQSWILVQIKKQSLVKDSRFEYWRQAAVAIQERPWFGSGPGTFYLQSLRLQKAPVSYSWFAHSFPLEVFVESGLIGLGLLYLLILTHQKHVSLVYMVNKQSVAYAGWASAFVFLYSFFEFSLNFVVIWLMFWVVLGLLAGEQQQSVKFRKNTIYPNFFVFITVFFLLIVCLFWVIGFSVGILPKTEKATLFLNFYRADAVIGYLDNSPARTGFLSKSDVLILNAFHRKDPRVVFELANKGNVLLNPIETSDLYGLAVTQDPQNFIYHKAHINFILTHKLSNQIIAALHQLNMDLVNWRINKINLSAPSLDTVSTGLAHWFVAANSESNPRLYLAKIYYFIGLSELSVDPKATKEYWDSARFMVPEVGLFDHELASLMMYEFKSPHITKKILFECLKIQRASAHCEKIISSPKRLLPPPGYIAGTISTIALHKK